MNTESKIGVANSSEPHIGGEAFDLGDTYNAIVRRWKDNGELIILFPDAFAAPGPGILIESYMRNGEHGAADYNVMLKLTAPVNYEDDDVRSFISWYERDIPCQLKLYKRRTAKMHEEWLKDYYLYS